MGDLYRNGKRWAGNFGGVRAKFPHLSDQYRKICKKVSFDFIDDNRTEYELSFRVVRFDLGNGNFENIVTNLSEDEFSAEDLKDIYWLHRRILLCHLKADILKIYLFALY